VARGARHLGGGDTRRRRSRRACRGVGIRWCARAFND
jgi:hypothetical protein